MLDLPRSTSQIAADHGLHRAEVTTLIVEHEIRTSPLGSATVVLPEDWPSLAAVLKQYGKKRARRRAAAGARRTIRIPTR